MSQNLNFNLSNPADSAHGTFSYTGPRDQWLIDRTRQWCGLHAKHEWSFRIDMARGIISFQFEDQGDADAFRRVTARSPTLITCR
jgi:hypothetical protein